ncbi:hypothetical protein JB92DRAFT_3139634 [Gautieria morchelliformis]|nr:hypothetical protein JB92DRAFT_3139634 [Gautieria morchelliformis]
MINMERGVLSEYSSQVFNDLGAPEDAYASLLQLKGEAALHTSIRDVFERHNMADKFGVTLLHRHFRMEEWEKLVAVHDTSTPWGPEAYDAHHLGEVLPQAFVFTASDAIVPFEYGFFTTATVINAPRFEAATKEFLVELGSLLFSLGLAQYLGLRVHPGLELKAHMLEFTVNRANISVDVNQMSVKSIPTSWFYHGPKTLRCSCHSHCTASNGKHISLSHTHT